MRCAHCEGDFTPKNVRGRFCSAKCRAAAWQATRDQELTLIAESLARTLARVRGLRRNGRPS
jgi:hypothetical protein